MNDSRGIEPCGSSLIAPSPLNASLGTPIIPPTGERTIFASASVGNVSVLYIHRSVCASRYSTICSRKRFSSLTSGRINVQSLGGYAESVIVRTVSG